MSEEEKKEIGFAAFEVRIHFTEFGWWMEKKVTQANFDKVPEIGKECAKTILGQFEDEYNNIENAIEEGLDDGQYDANINGNAD